MKHCAKTAGPCVCAGSVLRWVELRLPKRRNLPMSRRPAGAGNAAYEPNVAMAEDTTTIGDIATNGYQVTIPTTVTVESGENKGELEVNAKLKQYRTLNIGIESPNNWKLKYDAKETIANAPTVEYTLKNKIEAGGEHTPGVNVAL